MALDAADELRAGACVKGLAIDVKKADDEDDDEANDDDAGCWTWLIS